MNTSLSLNKKAAAQILSLSDESNTSISKIIEIMLNIILNKFSSGFTNDKLIEKTLCHNDGWKRLHYCPNKELHSKIHHYRWFYKISISGMVFVCFLFFWEEVVADCLGLEKDKKIKKEYIRNYEKDILYFHDFLQYYKNRLCIRFNKNLSKYKIE